MSAVELTVQSELVSVDQRNGGEKILGHCNVENMADSHAY